MTKKNSYNYKALVKQGFLLLSRTLSESYSLRKFQEECRIFITDQCSGLQIEEKERLFSIMSEQFRFARHHIKDGKWKDILCRDSRYDTFLRSARQVAAQKDSRTKYDAFYRATEAGYIFFFCDWHNNCGEDHIELQGRLYVDKHWRLHVPEELHLAVLSYIKNRNIMTVQEVMGKPYWLTTRPFCKHRFLPIDTATVLHSSLNMLKRRFPKQNRPVYSEQDYLEFKKEVYESLNNALPCYEFDRKLRNIRRQIRVNKN